MCHRYRHIKIRSGVWVYGGHVEGHLIGQMLSALVFPRDRVQVCKPMVEDSSRRREAKQVLNLDSCTLGQVLSWVGPSESMPLQPDRHK